jgi:phage-related protein
MERCILLLTQLGISLKMPHSRSIQGEKNLFELRSKVGTNIQRVLYFHYTGQVFVLLNGFTKKDDKTPPGEIDKAKRYRQDFLNAMEETDNG